MERLIECRLARGVNCIGLAVMYLVRGHQTDAAMVVVPVVPIEEAAAETSGVLDAAEALGELRLVLECLEVTFREWVVVGDVRPVVRAGNVERAGRRRDRPSFRIQRCVSCCRRHCTRGLGHLRLADAETAVWEVPGAQRALFEDGF